MVHSAIPDLLTHSATTLAKNYRRHSGLSQPLYWLRSTANDAYIVVSNPGRSSCSRSPTSGYPDHSSRYRRRWRFLVDDCLRWKCGSGTEARRESWSIRWRGSVSRRFLPSYAPTRDGWLTERQGNSTAKKNMPVTISLLMSPFYAETSWIRCSSSQHSDPYVLSSSEKVSPIHSDTEPKYDTA